MKLFSNKTVLFISPHCDNKVISAGALLATLAKNNNVIVYYTANSPRGVVGEMPDSKKIDIRQNEAKNSCKVLGVIPKFLNLDDSLKTETEYKNNLKLFESILKREKPSLVFTLYENDAHPTHQKVTRLINDAINTVNVPLSYGEVWTPIQKPDDAFFFNDDLMRVKLRAIKEYKSQLQRTDWVTAIKSLNNYRAVTLKETLGGFGNSSHPAGHYAEAFLSNYKKS